MFKLMEQTLYVGIVGVAVAGVAGAWACGMSQAKMRMVLAGAVVVGVAGACRVSQAKAKAEEEAAAAAVPKRADDSDEEEEEEAQRALLAKAAAPPVAVQAKLMQSDEAARFRRALDELSSDASDDEL